MAEAVDDEEERNDDGRGEEEGRRLERMIMEGCDMQEVNDVSSSLLSAEVVQAARWLLGGQYVDILQVGEWLDGHGQGEA